MNSVMVSISYKGKMRVRATLIKEDQSTRTWRWTALVGEVLGSSQEKPVTEHHLGSQALESGASETEFILEERIQCLLLHYFSQNANIPYLAAKEAGECSLYLKNKDSS